MRSIGVMKSGVSISSSSFSGKKAGSFWEFPLLFLSPHLIIIGPWSSNHHSESWQS